MTNTKSFDPNLLKIDKMSYESTDIYYMNYIRMKDHLNIYSVNLLYLVFNKINGHIKESNENKHLIFAPTDRKKETLTKYTEL